MSTSSVQKTPSISSGKELEEKSALVGMYGRKEIPSADIGGMRLSCIATVLGALNKSYIRQVSTESRMIEVPGGVHPIGIVTGNHSGTRSGIRILTHVCGEAIASQG
jgi:hypothetical protein